MRHVRMLGLCLTAMFVLVAFGASGAQASLPEIGKCEATAGNTGGKYKNAGCTERASRKKVGENEYVYYGGFEWTPLKSPSACESLAGHPGGFYSDAACTEKAPKVKGVYQGNYESSGFGVVTGHKATLGGTGTATYETQVGKKMTCTTLGRGTSVQFTVNGAKTPFWEFAGCESKGQECLTPFSAVEVGEVNDYVPWYFEAHFEELPEAGEPVPGWDGKLGYIEGKHTSPVVGMAWTARNNERFYEPIECESEATGTVWIGGNKRGGNTIIAQMTPVNQMTTHYTETYSSPSPGVQAVKQFESQHSPYALQAFVGNEWEPVALNATFNYTTDRAIEIKATP